MIEEIQAREKAATPEPWEWEEQVLVYREGQVVVLEELGFLSPANKDFIAQAREDIPYLLAQLRDRDEKLKTAHRAVEQLRQSLTVMQPGYEALKGKLAAVGELDIPHTRRTRMIGWPPEEVDAGCHESCRRCPLDRILKGGE